MGLLIGRVVNIVHSEEDKKFTAANNFQNKEITAFTSIPPLQLNSSSFRNLDEFPSLLLILDALSMSVNALSMSVISVF